MLEKDRARTTMSEPLKRSVGAVYINISMKCEKYKLESLAMLLYLLLNKVYPNRQKDNEVTNEIYNEL